MEKTIIRYRLDLLIRLVDTTTGAEVEERHVRFYKDGRPMEPVPRGSGSYAFLNCGREDCELQVEAYGYEICRVPIWYETLDSQLPVKEVFLIPSENTGKGAPVITFQGVLPGLEELQAVSIGTAWCNISAFDERKCIMTLFKTHRSPMNDVFYGLIHMDRQDFEPFVVEKELSDQTVKIRSPLQEPFSVNAPIARLIFGSVTQEGEYCLRVRDDSAHLKLLVRYVAQGSRAGVGQRIGRTADPGKEDRKWHNW